jgi:hypothetical protein
MKRASAGSDLYLPGPALPAAVESYLKRDFSQDQRDRAASSGAALPDGSFPIENRADLRNAVRAYGRAKNKPKAKAHIVSRARSLGATSSLPDTWKSVRLTVLKNLGNDEIMQGFAGAIDAFKSEQDAVKFSGDAADAVRKEYGNALMEEVGEAVTSLGAVYHEIMDDVAITHKREALQESTAQFKGHIKGIIPEGADNDLVGKALYEAGYQVSGGDLTKRETEMTFDIRKGLGLQAAATDGDVEKALTALLKASASAAAIAKMSAAHQLYLAKAKAKKEPMEEEDCEKFVGMSASERDAYIKKHPVGKAKKDDLEDDMDDDEDEEDAEKCLKMANGAVIRKSVVGDQTFQILKSQQADIQKMKDDAQLATFTKAAEGLKYIGKAAEVGGLIQRIAKSGGQALADAVIAKFEQINTVIEKGGATLFDGVGKAGGDAGGFGLAKAKLDTIAKDLMSKNKGMSIYKARTQARDMNPDLAKQEADEAEDEKDANKSKRRAA